MIGSTIKVVATAESGNTFESEETAEVAEPTIALIDVDQQTAKVIELTFEDDASDYITAEDIFIDSEDGRRHVPVLSLDWSEDGTTADATLSLALEDGITYVVTCGESEVEFLATIGDVTEVVINTISAPVNTRTKIEFSLYNAAGVDITDSVSINSTCRVEITGDATLESSTASNAYVTMTEEGDECEVKVIYNNNEAGFEDVIGTQTVKCTPAEAVYGEPIYLNTSEINAKSGSAKFYKKYTPVTTAVSLAEGSSLLADYGTYVYFCALDDNGDPIDYTDYSVESSDPDTMDVSMGPDATGKFCSIDVTGAAVGSANLVITATKNGKESYYTIPVVVTKVGKLATLTLTADKTTITNAIDDAYYGTLKVEAKDSNGKKLTPGTDYDYTVTIENADTKAGTNAIDKNITGGTNEALKAAATGFDITDTNDGKEFYEAPGASGGQRTITVVASDGENEVTRRQNITVKALTEGAWNNGLNAGTKITYAIELGSNSIKEWKDTTTRLVAKSGSDFAGYVRQDAEGLTTIGNALGNGTVGTVSTADIGTGKAVFTSVEKDAAKNFYKFQIEKSVAAVAAHAASGTQTGPSGATFTVPATVNDPECLNTWKILVTSITEATEANQKATVNSGTKTVSIAAKDADQAMELLNGITASETAGAVVTAEQAQAFAAMTKTGTIIVDDTTGASITGGVKAVAGKTAGSVAYVANPAYERTTVASTTNFIGTYTFIFDAAGYTLEQAQAAWLEDADGLASGFRLTAWTATAADDESSAFSQGGETSVAAPGTVLANAASTIKDVTVGVKKGTKYSTTGALYDSKNNFKADIDNLAKLDEVQTSTDPWDKGALLLDAFDSVTVDPYYVVNDQSFDGYFAQPGSYTVQYTYVDNNGKTQKPNMSLRVEKSIWTPSIKIENTLPSSTSANDILEMVKANVDMNNNTSYHESVDSEFYSKLAMALDTDTGNYIMEKTIAEDNAKGQLTVKYMVVDETLEDTNTLVHFYVPVAHTFTPVS